MSQYGPDHLALVPAFLGFFAYPELLPRNADDRDLFLVVCCSVAGVVVGHWDDWGQGRHKDKAQGRMR